MGWQFRKSFNLGPFRVTASRSGIGWSVGAGGFRTGVSSRGRNYTSVRVPGTGLSYQAGPGGLGCLLVAGLVLLAVVVASLCYWFSLWRLLF